MPGSNSLFFILSKTFSFNPEISHFPAFNINAISCPRILYKLNSKGFSSIFDVLLELKFLKKLFKVFFLSLSDILEMSLFLVSNIFCLMLNSQLPKKFK